MWPGRQKPRIQECYKLLPGFLQDVDVFELEYYSVVGAEIALSGTGESELGQGCIAFGSNLHAAGPDVTRGRVVV